MVKINDIRDFFKRATDTFPEFLASLLLWGFCLIVVASL